MVLKSPTRSWQDLTWVDFEGLDAEDTVVVLPVAAIEQHGPHLPLAVDAIINRGILDRALALVPADRPVLVLPAMTVGKSDEHLAFAGTLSLSAETLAEMWTEVGESVRRAGLRKLVLFNSHGGNPETMKIIARRLRVRHGMLAVTTSWGDVGLPDELFSDAELAHGIHGGAIETSMMLHLAPDLVRLDEVRDFPSLGARMAREFDHLRPDGAASFGWMTQDLNPDGACGNAADADAERGRRLVDHAAAGLVALMDEVRRFPLDRLKQGPDDA
ncbi:MAG: creatininase family protein [Inquilinaceae bacterium]